MYARRCRKISLRTCVHDVGIRFTTAKGTPLDACNVSKQFKTLLKTAELAPLRIHDLLHSRLCCSPRVSIPARSWKRSGTPRSV